MKKKMKKFEIRADICGAIIFYVLIKAKDENEARIEFEKQYNGSILGVNEV